jgi:[NiFe] hydrogenase diaphorase moiety small subunit
MVVENDTETDARAPQDAIVEMLFVEGNHFCMFCEKSGNCELQAMAYRLGIAAPRYPTSSPSARSTRAPGRAARPQPLHPLRPLRADVARCRRQERLRVRRPGHPTSASRSTRMPAGEHEPRAADQAVEACPVGAILKKRVGYAVPVGSANTTRADRHRDRNQQASV